MQAVLGMPGTDLITAGLSLKADPSAHFNQTTVKQELNFPQDWPAGASDVGYS